MKVEVILNNQKGNYNLYLTSTDNEELIKIHFGLGVEAEQYAVVRIDELKHALRKLSLK